MSKLETIVTFSSQSECNLDNYPSSSTISVAFNGNDCTIYAYVEQFRCFLKGCGFSESSIKDALGEF